jgi:hypothetical protein
VSQTSSGEGHPMKITTTEGWALFVSGFTHLEHCSISIRNSFRISVSTSDFSAA